MEIEVPLNDFNLADNGNTDAIEETPGPPNSAKQENGELPGKESVNVDNDRDKLFNEIETEIRPEKKHKHKRRHSRKHYKTMAADSDLAEKMPIDDFIDDTQTNYNLIKRIDYVLIYPDKHPEEETHRNKQKELEKHILNRQQFEEAIKEEGVEIQKQKHKENMFVKVHVPFLRLCNEAEKCKLEMPLSGVS
jgi:hypothetical protein